MKRELKWIAIVVWWFVLLGVIAPALISEPDTLAVVVGLVLVLASTYATYRLARGEIKHALDKTNQESEQ